MFFIFILAFTAMLLAWIDNTRISDFKAGHVAIANETTTSVKEAIARFISERRRFVTVFTLTHHDTLSAIVNDAGNDTLHDNLMEKLTLFFPKHFAYSIANSKGDTLFDNFDGLLGTQCIDDLRNFAINQTHSPKIHPNSELYHFDIMVPFTVDDKKYTFFLSFDADLLAEILSDSSVPDHELILTLPVQDRKLIEATANGSRVHLDRNDFRMTQKEEDRVLSSKLVPNTEWEIYDLQKAGLLQEFNFIIYLISAAIYLIFFPVALSWYRSTIKIEKIRQESDEHKAEFLSTVSHELRTPLTAIKGSIGLIAGNFNNESSEQTQKLSELALKNTERLINIVNDLLDIQKIESGKLKLELKDENLTALVEQSLDAMKDYGKQFEVKYQLLDLIPNEIVKVDSNRFIQVMNNLLSNATKYGKHNDVVEVCINPYKDGVRVSVSDNGSGIKKDSQDKIFNKFYQGNGQKESNVRVESTGLGLHISRELVNSMNAKIDFSSSEKGTVFYIDFKKT
ncbi:MAG: HAMP domain-containing histidine kinase [Gammaproteobacteria bacterium]|nr:HAMP domain-containing histidine kinase [Gammaproteobacteria bacterium]